MKKTTEKEQRLRFLNTILTARKREIKAGATFTAREFTAFFRHPYPVVEHGTYKDLHRSHMRLVGLQADVNALLRESGLYVASRDYYTTFYVKDLNETKSKIERTSKKVDTKAEEASRMIQRIEARMATRNYGSYNKVPLPRIKSIVAGTSPTNRHTLLLNRISLI